MPISPLPRVHRRPATAGLTLALALLASSAHAQQTDGRWLVSLGIAPLVYEHANTDIESGPAQESDLWRIGLGGQASLLAGLGVGAWVFALELTAMHSEETTEQQLDASSSASVVEIESSQTRVGIGPDVRYLFIEGKVRPLFEVGVGIGLEHSDFGSERDLTTLYVHGGPGVQLQLVDFASLDLLLRAEYATSSGEYAAGLVLANGGSITLSSEPLDVDVKAFELGLHARLSLWP